MVVVRVEPAIEAEAPVEREAGHERARAIARLPEILGRGRHGCGQHEAAVVAEPMSGGSESGEQARVGRTGEGRVRDRGREAAAPRGQAVERGRGRSRVTVAADVIGAQGVDGHEEDVRTVGGDGSRHGRRRARASGPQRADRENRGRKSVPSREKAESHHRAMRFESVQKVAGPLNPALEREKEFDRSQREGIESSNSYRLLAITWFGAREGARDRIPSSAFLSLAVIGHLSRRR